MYKSLSTSSHPCLNVLIYYNTYQNKLLYYRLYRLFKHLLKIIVDATLNKNVLKNNLLSVFNFNEVLFCSIPWVSYLCISLSINLLCLRSQQNEFLITPKDKREKKSFCNVQKSMPPAK